MELLGGVDPWYLILGATFAAVLFAVIGTWPMCALLLRGYRRRVDRAMRAQGAVAAPASVPEESPPSRESSPIRVEEIAGAKPVGVAGAKPVGIAGAKPVGVAGAEPVGVAGAEPVELLARAERRAQRMRLVVGVAGLVYGLAATAVYHLVDGMAWQPVRIAAYTLLLGWPVLPAVIATSVIRPRLAWLAWVGYLASAAALLTLAGLPVTELLVMTVPVLFVLATGVSSLRGAAWLVAPGLAIIGLVVVALWPVAVYLYYRAPFDRYAWTFLAVAVGLLVLLVGYGGLLARLYQAKWASDQTLLTLQWSFVTALWWTMLLGTQGEVAALAGLAPYALLLLILVGTWLLGGGYRERPVRLLLLRTFGSRKRSTRLFRDLTMGWRWIGSVELITGVDLATEILEPDEFLDYIRGRLSHRFVRSDDSLRQRMVDLDLRPDRDGRYRVNELLCSDDMWRPALEALISDVDAVVVDLRAFVATNVGVRHELERLVALSRLSSVVGLVDATTDRAALQAALDGAGRFAPASTSPAADAAPVLRVVVLDRAGTEAARRLLRAVAEAASARQ